MHLTTQLVDEFQILLKGYHAVHGIVRVALLHAYEKLRRQVQGKTGSVADPGDAAWLAELCSSGISNAVLCSSGISNAELRGGRRVAVCHNVAVTLVCARELATGRTHACWPIQVRCERVQRVHCLCGLGYAGRYACGRPLLSNAILINRNIGEHRTNLLAEASASDVLRRIYGQCLLRRDLGARNFVLVKAHGDVLRDVRLGGRQCLHDLLRPRLRQQDRVAHEAFLLSIGRVAVAQHNEPADHDGQPQKSLSGDGEISV